MTFHTLSLVLSGILCFADYLTEKLFSKELRANHKLVSFSSGVAISYIILNLFPEISSYAIIDGRKLFLYALSGFLALNMIEQYVYKGIGKLRDLPRYHKNVHTAYFFAYNFSIGIVLVSFAAKGLAQALLFFVPFFFYIVAEILPRQFEFKRSTSQMIYSMAPLFGTLFGAYHLDFTYAVFGELVSFITGTLLYIVIREFLPTDRAEKPFYFMAGVLFYSAVIAMSWNFV